MQIQVSTPAAIIISEQMQLNGGAPPSVQNKIIQLSEDKKLSNNFFSFTTVSMQFPKIFW